METMGVNLMLDHRGVRLGISYPEIYRMQIRALLEAAAQLLAKGAHGVRISFEFGSMIEVAKLTAAQARLQEVARTREEHEHPDYPFKVFFQRST